MHGFGIPPVSEDGRWPKAKACSSETTNSLKDAIRIVEVEKDGSQFLEIWYLAKGLLDFLHGLENHITPGLFISAKVPGQYRGIAIGVQFLQNCL